MPLLDLFGLVINAEPSGLSEAPMDEVESPDSDSLVAIFQKSN